MRQNVPDHLQSTYDLVLAAFPDGIDADLYLPLLRFLGQYLSHRNLASLIALVTGEDDYDRAMGDVVDSLANPLIEQERAAITRLLQPYGLDTWLAESRRAILKT